MNRRRALLWVPVLLYMAGIFAVSAQPDPPMPGSADDKSLHLAAYAGLAVLVFRAVSGGLPRRVTRRAALATLVVTIAYGATDEFHQLYVPGRSADVYDLLADAAGAALGLIACSAWGLARNPKARSPKPESER